jgi:hypothetical protein
VCSSDLNEIAKGGGKAASSALRELGLNAKDLAGSSLFEQFTKIGDALLKIENPSARAATAQRLFGKGVRELLPFLLQGSEGLGEMLERFETIAGNTTTEAASSLDDVGDSFDTMKTAINDAAIGITARFAPALKTLFDAIADGLPKADKGMKDFTATLLLLNGGAGQKIEGGIASLLENIGKRLNIRPLRDAAKYLRADAAAVTQVLDQIAAEQAHQTGLAYPLVSQQGGNTCGQLQSKFSEKWQLARATAQAGDAQHGVRGLLQRVKSLFQHGLHASSSLC